MANQLVILSLNAVALIGRELLQSLMDSFMAGHILFFIMPLMNFPVRVLIFYLIFILGFLEYMIGSQRQSLFHFHVAVNK